MASTREAIPPSRPAAELPAPISINAKRFRVVNETELIVGYRKLYTKFIFDMGNLPWTTVAQNETVRLPDQRELQQWYSHGLVRVGAEGYFYGQDAIDYYNDPFKTERWVTESVINKSEKGRHVFFSNLRISWTAYMMQLQVRAHLQMKNGSPAT